MTVYFLLSLIASILLAAGLFIWLIYRLRINRTGRNKKGYEFLLPILITILFFSVAAADTFPRLLDVLNIAQNNIKTIQVSGDQIDVNRNRYLIEGELYMSSFPKFKIAQDRMYQISYLPQTKIIVKQKVIETLPDINDPNSPVIEELPPKN